MRKIVQVFLVIFLSFALSFQANAVISGSSSSGTSCSFFNPFADVCWDCIFPIRMGGVKFATKPGFDDTTTVHSPVCVCNTPLPRLGITMSIWAPMRLSEVVKNPWSFPSLCLDFSVSPFPQGSSMSHSVTNAEKQTAEVHWYYYPILAMMGIAQDFACMSNSAVGFDVAYTTELDPAWNDDYMSDILYPETLLFANPAAEFACIPDRLLTSVKRFGIPALFWCAGNWGTTYPFYKTSSGGWINVTALLTARVNAMLHRNFVAYKTIGEDALCQPTFSAIFVKDEYRYQIAKPISGTCVPVGAADFWWATLKEPPVGDNYHVYVVWRKRDCCAF
ncbi:TraU family protein [Desulfurobacterium sp.]